MVQRFPRLVASATYSQNHNYDEKKATKKRPIFLCVFELEMSWCASYAVLNQINNSSNFVSHVHCTRCFNQNNTRQRKRKTTKTSANTIPHFLITNSLRSNIEWIQARETKTKHENFCFSSKKKNKNCQLLELKHIINQHELCALLCNSTEKKRKTQIEKEKKRNSNYTSIMH